jgi:hypothetical protein
MELQACLKIIEDLERQEDDEPADAKPLSEVTDNAEYVARRQKSWAKGRG